MLDYQNPTGDPNFLDMEGVEASIPVAPTKYPAVPSLVRFPFKLRCFDITST
jgi:hypothetical protein